jgi:hypothetical protein
MSPVCALFSGRSPSSPGVRQGSRFNGAVSPDAGDKRLLVSKLTLFAVPVFRVPDLTSARDVTQLTLPLPTKL